ncbi:uncharacterized protein LOC131945251 isoform X2 [Physella acuta]|uniref:uncharacterized protein LOC131945251 isoform X2 n=1 Tax=Physella acuta TaxID=109671 RepID=UPI0027DE2FC4|nr:uncharacterized protein LOC131945251 isoform X2 [Physella acuta]
MYDQELDPNAPYDNVEFPVRKPGTGTWPGPASSGSSTSAGPSVKLFGHQTTGRGGGGSKLAPLVEVEGSEGGDGIIKIHNLGITSQTTASGSYTPGSYTSGSYTSGSSTSGSYTAGSYTQQQHTSPGKVSTMTVTSQSAPTASQGNGLVGEANTNSTKTTSNASTAGTEMTSLAAFPTATTTTTTTTTTQSSSASAKQTTAEKTGRPMITLPNDGNTYVATQVAPSETLRKKTTKQVENEEEDFKRQDLNPGARLALERVYTQHPDFYQLNTKVLDEGSLLKQDVLDIYRKTGETLTYEQLLQGMLVDGERFLLGSCWLYYTHVQFLDVEGTRTLREPYGRGRVGLTSKRALFLSTETYTDANVEQFEDPTKKTDKLGYKLEVSKRSTITFKNIPLSNFHSAEMEVVTGTAAQTKITKKIGCCACLGLPTSKWVATPPMTRSINARVLRVGVSMPPWQTRMFLDIHLDPSMSLTVARDFISQLHSFAPHMH